MNKTKITKDNIEIFVKGKTDDEIITSPVVRDFNALLDLMQDLGNKVVLAKDSEFKNKFGSLGGIIITNEIMNNKIYLGRITASFNGKCIREIYSCFMKFRGSIKDSNLIEPIEYDLCTAIIYIDPASRINDCALLLEQFLNSGKFPEAESGINYIKV